MKLTYWIFFSMVVLSGCNKSTPAPPTSIKLTIIDSLGNPVKGATASLYNTAFDHSIRANQIGSSPTSGSDGVILFTNLKSQSYFWYVSNGCDDNSFTVKATWDGINQDPIKANAINSFTVPIFAVGTLKFVASSNNAYQISGTNVDPNALINIFGINGSGTTSESFPLGTFSITIRESTRVPTPYDTTFNVAVTCGTTVIKVP